MGFNVACLETFSGFFITLLLGTLLIQNINIVKKSTLPKKNISTLLITSALIIFILILPLLIILLLVMIVYRQIIHLTLKFKFGNSYIGLVQGSDVVHTIDETANSKTSILIIFEHDCVNSSKPFYAVAKEVFNTYFNKNLKHFKKFSSEYRNFMGYTYMTRANNLLANECLKEMDPIQTRHEEIEEIELFTLLSNAYNSDFPRNNTIFWDLSFSTQSIKWKDNADKNKEYYAALLRNHHCLADGVALFKLIVGIFADKNIKVASSKCYNENLKEIPGRYDRKDFALDAHIQSSFQLLTKICNTVFECIKIVALAPSSIYVNLLLRANDKNVLHNSNLSGESMLMFHVEQDNTYFQKIKKIKQKLPATSFPEIILTAWSASLSNYYQKKTDSCPEYITTAIPVVPNSAELQYLEPGSLSATDIKLFNNYALILLNLPLYATNESNKPVLFTERLQLLKDQISILYDSVDFQVNYVLMNKIFSILPHSFIKFFLNTFHCTTTISIMPGSCKLSFGDGALFGVDSGFWVPHLKNIGISFSAFTFDGRLFVGLSVDKNMMVSVQEGKDIISDVFKNINLFEKEIS